MSNTKSQLSFQPKTTANKDYGSDVSGTLGATEGQEKKCLVCRLVCSCEIIY